MTEMVILVDENDREVGVEEKLAAHQKGLLHRAFSVFVFNSKGELLLQKRAAGKYHSAGLWSNTCCSHPLPKEDTLGAAHRRLKEEMGFDCDLRLHGHLLYKTVFANGLTEHEFDYIYSGQYEGTIDADPIEAEEWKWVNTRELLADIAKEPERYTYWLNLALPTVLGKR